VGEGGHPRHLGDVVGVIAAALDATPSTTQLRDTSRNQQPARQHLRL
jgi:hypothetical protein